MTSLRLGLLASLVLPLGLATASFAQPAPPPAPPAPAGDMQHHHHDPAQMRAHMADHLRTVLQLTASQDPALNAFLDAMHPPGGADMDRHHDHDQDQHLTTPQRLDKMLAHFDAQRARMVAHAEAVKTFYAQLTPTQQAAFDDLAPMMMMHHGDGERHADGGDHDGMHRHHDGDQPMGPGGPPQG
jgi:periplasmic protein CpxP/Spy